MYTVDINGTVLKLGTVPGLFSPDGLDAGTKAMLDVFTRDKGDNILDLGCGAGVVGLYAAALGCKVTMSDIDPVAVKTAMSNALLNGFTDINAVVSDAFDAINAKDFDRILSNPPYHADFSVPKRFIEKGFNRLCTGGKMLMVTKRLDWYKNKFISVFGGVNIERINGYFVFVAEKRSMKRSDR